MLVKRITARTALKRSPIHEEKKNSTVVPPITMEALGRNPGLFLKGHFSPLMEAISVVHVDSLHTTADFWEPGAASLPICSPEAKMSALCR